MDSLVAKRMADVLNRRGFLTHDDFPICTDDDFGDYLCAHEELLREEGYSGGALQTWSSSFRLALAYTYGVLDSENHPGNELLDAYTLATGSQLEESGLLARDLKPLLIGLQYLCKCGHTTNVDPGTIPFKQQNIPIHRIEALCGSSKCECLLCPDDTYPLFEGI